jgi:hypothetical protein
MKFYFEILIGYSQIHNLVFSKISCGKKEISTVEHATPDFPLKECK